MTLNDTKKLLAAIEAIYPTWKVDNPQETAAAWHWALEEYPAPAVKAALQIYVRTSTTAFAPSVSQIINCMHAARQNDALTEGEAWALAKRAIADGNYHSTERFNELPKDVQDAIGGADMLREWAQSDSDTVNTVIMSNFQRTYRAVLNRKQFDEKITPQIAEVIRGVYEKIEDKGG